MRLGVVTASPNCPIPWGRFTSLLFTLLSSAYQVLPIVPTATVSDQMGGSLFSPDGPFRHAAAFAIEEGQYSEPIE